MWEPPVDRPCDIIGYNLTYKLLKYLACNYEEEANATDITTTNPHYRITGLSPHSEYVVSVVALTAAGTGNQTTTVVQTMQDGEFLRADTED